MDSNNTAQGGGSKKPDSEADGNTAHVPPPPAKPPVKLPAKPPVAPPAGVPPVPARTPAPEPANAPGTHPVPVSGQAGSRDPRSYDTVGSPVEGETSDAGTPHTAAPYTKPPYTEPSDPKPRDDRTKQLLINASIIVTGLVLLGLLVWGVMTVLNMGSQDSEASGGQPSPTATETTALPLPREGVSPLDFRLGDCFKDFDPDAEKATVVACDTEHSAQLVAVHHYEDNNAYPGLNALKEKGREICQNARLSPAYANYVLLQRNTYPSTTSWEIGDRRVDCYITADAGNVIKENLLPAGT